MLNAKVDVKIDLKPLEKYVEILSQEGKSGHNQLMIKWLVRYKKFAKAQFNKNSKGGGSWPPLRPRTRKRVKKRSRAILKDSETLVHTLEPIPTLDRNPVPGIITTRTRKGIAISFGGAGRHPYSKLSIARLAKVHHLGLGRVPKRAILVAPTDEVKRLMVNDVRTTARDVKKRLGLT